MSRGHGYLPHAKVEIQSQGCNCSFDPAVLCGYSQREDWERENEKNLKVCYT